MTPEAKAAAQAKRAATLQAKRERIARREAWLLADKGRAAKLAKIEAAASYRPPQGNPDARGNENMRALAEATAAKFRTIVVPEPDAAPPLPRTLVRIVRKRTSREAPLPPGDWE